MESILLNELCKIPGIGIIKANELIQAGVKRKSDLRLRKFNILLSQQTKLAINYPTSPISWDIANSLVKIFPEDVIPVGSYRREKAFINDLDILTIRPLEEIMAHLEKISEQNKKITNTNTTNKSSFRIMGSYMEGSQKVSLIVSFKDLFIHIDIFKTNNAELPYALLHFTGSVDFNIKVRAQAKNLGYKLNQHGLYSIETGNLIKPRSRTEKEILKKINVQYIEPWSR